MNSSWALHQRILSWRSAWPAFALCLSKRSLSASIYWFCTSLTYNVREKICEENQHSNLPFTTKNSHCLWLTWKCTEMLCAQKLSLIFFLGGNHMCYAETITSLAYDCEGPRLWLSCKNRLISFIYHLELITEVF